MRRVRFGLTAALIIALVGGCRKSAPGTAEGQGSSPQRSDTIARIHWLGKDRISAETNAAGFMGIWRMTESARMEAQILDKLATAPWRLQNTNTPVSASSSQLPGTNQPSTLNPQPSTNRYPLSTSLRPLLDDLVLQESCLEIRQAGTNQPGELAFAIRLNLQRAALWQTNLAAVLESLTGSRSFPAPAGVSGWQLRLTNQPSTINHQPSTFQFTRAGDWTLVGLAQGHSALLDDIAARIQRDHAPFAAQRTNHWLEADLDLISIARAFAPGLNLPDGLPELLVTVTGDGTGVQTRGQLNFPKPLPFQLEPWNIPTNLMQGHLSSLTAVQGLRPWLEPLGVWTDLQAGLPPNQFYVWATGGRLWDLNWAAPMPDASNFVCQVGERLIRRGNPWIRTNNSSGYFAWATNGMGVDWKKVPFISPFLRAVRSNGAGFLYGGVEPYSPTNLLPVRAFPYEAMARSNLVYFDGELTGERIEGWLRLGQLFRLLAWKTHLPPNSPSMAWLTNAAPRLGDCVTVVTRTGPAQLTLARKSTVGFTALELHLLADWLESPLFPHGLNTFEGPPRLNIRDLVLQRQKSMTNGLPVPSPRSRPINPAPQPGSPVP